MKNNRLNKISSDTNILSLDALIIGAGFSGLYQLYSLKKLGLSAKVIEAGSGVGGTWYWNRYPGAACDTEAYIYLPLCEELGVVPTQKYAQGPEILKHSQHLAQHYQLYDNACLQTEVTNIHWDESTTRWVIETNRGDAMRARYVIMSTGPIHRPKLPGIPGIKDYKGHTFHTSRWDYAYTGGSPEGNLKNLVSSLSLSTSPASFINAARHAALIPFED